MFDSIGSLAVAQNMRELYKYVLVDTPLAEYFSECLSSEDLDEMNIEIMRNTLYKAYLDDFNKCVPLCAVMRLVPIRTNREMSSRRTLNRPIRIKQIHLPTPQNRAQHRLR